MAIANCLNLTGTGLLVSDGDATFTYGSVTQGAVLLGGANSTITDTGVLSKGVTLVGDGAGAPTQLSVGANTTVFTADSAQSSGVGYAAKPSGTNEAWSYVSTTTISSDATKEVTGMTTANSSYVLFLNIAPQTDGIDLYMRSSSNGSTYDSGTGNYGRNNGATANQMLLTFPDVGNAAGESYHATIWIINPQDSLYTAFLINAGFPQDAGDWREFSACWFRLEANQVQAVQFYANTGNLASGSIRLYEIAGS